MACRYVDAGDPTQLPPRLNQDARAEGYESMSAQGSVLLDIACTHMSVFEELSRAQRSRTAANTRVEPPGLSWIATRTRACAGGLRARR